MYSVIKICQTMQEIHAKVELSAQIQWAVNMNNQTKSKRLGEGLPYSVETKLVWQFGRSWWWMSTQTSISLNGRFPTIFYTHPGGGAMWVEGYKSQQDRWGTTEAHSSIHCCSGKGTVITYSECVYVALGIQNAERMRRIISISVACPAIPYFSTLSHKRHDFRGGGLIVRKMCFFLYKRLTETFLILRRIQRDAAINVYRSSCKVPVILVTV